MRFRNKMYVTKKPPVYLNKKHAVLEGSIFCFQKDTHGANRVKLSITSGS